MDFTDIDAVAMSDSLATRLEWAKRKVELPAGRYETLLPPEAVADFFTFAHYFGGSARDAVDGGRCSAGPVAAPASATSCAARTCGSPSAATRTPPA